MHEATDTRGKTLSLQPGATDQHREHHHFEIPRLVVLARHAGPHLLEATLIPLGIFYLSLWQWGAFAAIWAALGWSYLALLYRVATRRRVPGLLILGVLGLSARSVIAVASGSVFIYFLQPILATAALGAAFLLSIPYGRPLVERLADDFVPFPPGFVKRPAVRRVFTQLTMVWALVNLLNAAGTICLLLSEPVATYLAARTGLTSVVTGAGVLVSVWWFKRKLRGHVSLSSRRAAARA